MSSTGNELVSSVNTASSSQFSFARNRSTTVSPSRLPTFQRPGKSYLRQIYIGSVQGLNILLDRTVLVKFNTHEANVSDIIAKFSEAVYEEQDDIEDFILTDTKGNQILDTEATRGLGYWKGSARKIVGLTLTDFNSFKNSTLRRTRITDPEDKKRKLEDIEEKLNEIYSAGKKLKSISDGIDTIFRQVSSQTTVRLSGLQSEAVKNSFTCLICKDLLKEPMFAKCCSTIVGCKVCVEEWLRNSTQCHKCRSRGAKDKVFPIVGIDDGLEVLQAIVSE
ncbi:uncharacterized protein LOC143058959 [Mytilus galloprovincialis]|uniref:uncharacterized protein LOC143058959 n=1 Tax=Mytilus galloprovincialis TaxID=29158 RepID=UPI003F7C6B3F